MTAWTARRARWFLPAGASLFLLLLTLLFFHKLAFSGLILARGDTYNYFYPYWDARNAAFRAGALPLWTNALFMGAPLLANPQLGTFYPPNWLTAPFRAPIAIAISILLHIALAAAGTCYLYRQAISRRWLPALAAGSVFAFSAYLGARAEQINQLQGLAWLPLLFALFHRLQAGRKPRRDGLLLALAWALQIFSGHTQTVFISGIGLGLYAVLLDASGRGRRLLLLAVCFSGALLLALPQLLPSFELMRLSNRGGGFDLAAATAFSLPPNLLGRALLPSYDGQLFGEYAAAPGLIALGLALWAAFAPSRRQKWLWLLLALAGLALALGRYNPLYLLLAELPGFNLFRVPARFLGLFSLAIALLAGLGLESLAEKARDKRQIALVGGGLGLLIGLTRFVLLPDPQQFFGAADISGRAFLLWLGAWLALLVLLISRHRWTQFAAVALLLAELFLAAQNLPYNDLAPPQVYLGQRFTISQLRAYQAEERPPGRALSISQLYFDPGDIAALRQRYTDLNMEATAQFHALAAVKKQETLMPNLPLTWNIPTIDGFGGGITPSAQYSLFASLLLPAEAAPAVDGRLGERLAQPACRGACLPELRWLQATDTRYLISDKVYDVWHEDIAYDTTLARFWATAPPIELPDAIYDQARILHRASGAAAEISLPDGLAITITDRASLASALQNRRDILALTFVNSRQPQIFQQLPPPPFERALSSDIKIYRRPAAGQRAFLTTDIKILDADKSADAAALDLLRAGDAVILQGAAEELPRSDLAGADVSFSAYTDEYVALEAQSPAPAYLILADAFYPGWQATVNGTPTPIYRANLLFRAVPLPAGQSEVIFRFAPALWRAALYIGAGLWMIAILLLWRWRRV